ncbi:MAG: hypothetical protein H0V89_03440 [Deltaproteobacteria bacterium]|nr:hypothetical protein [Deltaproteobacteria bacterium]
MRWFGVAVLAGCGATKDGGTGAGASGCEPGSGPTVTIGTGERGFEPMPDEVELVHGPQGGYHVVVAFDAQLLDASEVVFGVVDGTIDGEVVATSEPYLDMRCNPDTGTLQASGVLLIYPLTPEALADQPTRITATLTDSFGGVATGSVETTIVDPLID